MGNTLGNMTSRTAAEENVCGFRISSKSAGLSKSSTHHHPSSLHGKGLILLRGSGLYALATSTGDQPAMAIRQMRELKVQHSLHQPAY
jgi:hypothetical protein